ncbi:MAG: RNA 2',3'-cyclic phosphodiesterase [Thermoprotei archaeon]
MRVFIAVDLPEGEAKRSVAALINSLKNKQELKTVSPENLHFTLAFIGETNAEEVNKVCKIVDDINQAAFTAELSGLGFFPNKGTPRVIWIGVPKERGGDKMVALANSIRQALKENNISFDPKPFAPHLTLARVRERATAKNIELTSANLGDFYVDKFSVKESVLTRSGPIYKDLKIKPLFSA